MNKMIIANLVHRPLRSVISVIAVGVEVTMILLIVGLALGMLDDTKNRQLGIGADVMVRPPGTTVLTAFSGSPVPIKVADILRRQDHVVAVTPVVTQVTSSTNLEVLYGIEQESFQSVGGSFRFLEGGPFATPDDAIVDDLYAASNKVGAGSILTILNHKFRVSGVVLHGRGARRYIPIKTMQDLVGAENKASIFYVKLDTPDNADPVAAEFNKIPGMESYNIMSMREYTSLMSADHIPGLSIFINVVIGVSTIIGFIVIFQSMYTAVMERTREIGILKSLGASKMFIVSVVLRETLMLAIGGILCGIAISYMARAGIRLKWPTLPIQFTLGWGLRAAVIAVIGAFLGAVYPAFKAAQKDPIDALAYE